MPKIKFILLFFVINTSCNTNENSKNHYLTSSWSKVEFYNLCQKREFQLAPIKIVKEHEGKTFYNKKIVETDKFTQISFDFISDCCQTFLGEYEDINGNLHLYYFPDSSSIKCECKCDYRMTYTFVHNHLPKKEWNRINIKKK